MTALIEARNVRARYGEFEAAPLVVREIFALLAKINREEHHVSAAAGGDRGGLSNVPFHTNARAISEPEKCWTVSINRRGSKSRPMALQANNVRI